MYDITRETDALRQQARMTETKRKRKRKRTNDGRPACRISLCGDAAHLHEEVLPEVMLGEFHTAARALEVIDFVEELYVGATSLLGLPVTQGRLAEVHTSYFPRARGISTGCRDMFGNDIYRSAIFGSALLDEKIWLGRSHE